jgi:hypothetical protein
MRRPRVEILYFEGCPNHKSARALVERVAAVLRVEPAIELVEVADPDAAADLRFLGSPTIRVDGRDVEPGAEERHEFVFACRVYRSERGLAGQPDAAWIRDALTRGGKMTVRLDARNDQGELPERVAAARAMAEIPASKLGAARRAGLTDSERELYLWILRRFAGEGRPRREEVRAAAQRLGIDAEQGLDTLAREDLVHRGSDGEIAVAYPFSGRPTPHRVRFPGGQEVDAMCAIDALGIAPMFAQPIEIDSRDPRGR